MNILTSANLVSLCNLTKSVVICLSGVSKGSEKTTSILVSWLLDAKAILFVNPFRLGLSFILVIVDRALKPKSLSSYFNDHFYVDFESVLK